MSWRALLSVAESPLDLSPGAAVAAATGAIVTLGPCAQVLADNGLPEGVALVAALSLPYLMSWTVKGLKALHLRGLRRAAKGAKDVDDVQSE